jgi:nucleoid DNA-binding protein
MEENNNLPENSSIIFNDENCVENEQIKIESINSIAFQSGALYLISEIQKMIAENPHDITVNQIEKALNDINENIENQSKDKEMLKCRGSFYNNKIHNKESQVENEDNIIQTNKDGIIIYLNNKKEIAVINCLATLNEISIHDFLSKLIHKDLSCFAEEISHIF